MSESPSGATESKGVEDALKVVEPVQDSTIVKPEATEADVKEKSAEDVSVAKAEEDEENPPSLPQRKAKSEGSETTDDSSEKNPIFEQLKDAFPNMESKFIKAVIIASQGALDPAFNALLYLSDPESGKDIELPKKPVTAEAPQLPARRRQTQLEQDEMLARQLDEQFNKSRQRSQRRKPTSAEREAHQQRLRDRQRRGNRPLGPESQRGPEDEDEDSWAQFMEKDLPELRERANRSIQDTATKLNGWISGIKKNFVGENTEETQNTYQSGGYYDDPYSRGREQEYFDEKTPKKPERRRFNSFGAEAQEDSLESHGITLQDDDVNDDLDEEGDIPPQLGSQRSEKESVDSKVAGDGKIVAQTTYIDTPDNATRKKWQPVPPEPLNSTPTKSTLDRDQSKKSSKNADEDEFLINSEDEM